jgi:TonB family protein
MIARVVLLSLLAFGTMVSPAHPQGAQSGMVLVDVDQKTGKVTNARILQSTGNAAYDEAAVKRFRQWRFKPGATARQVKIPITFVPAGSRY